MKPKILSYGETIFDLVEDRPFLGGAPLNFAWFVNQLGGETTFISSVGKDDLGLEAISIIETYGIDSHINFSNQPTGTAVVNSDGKFNLTYPAAWSEIEIPELDIGSYDLLYLGTLTQTSTFNCNRIDDLVKTAAKKVFLDLNLRYPFYSTEIIHNSLEIADIVKVNLKEWHEIKNLFSIEDPFAFMARFNLVHLAITMGDKGAKFFSAGQEFQYQPRKVTEVDPTGAGDAFSAGFALGVLSEIPIMKILRGACNAGAAVAGTKGAHMELPNIVRAEYSL
ncbi:PfkB family carbohydrate kinase [Chloroflexi bacterium]|nr:PfkB family carbohydrate kinase [Chloroflexota bacterium]